MRFSAKALPCLLSCLVCVTVAPADASAHMHLPLSPPRLHADAPASGHHAHVDRGVAIARRRIKVHHAAPKPVQAAPHDTSNRFLMTQNGKQMTADDFDAWMKTRGFRVAKGAPESAKATD
jgi:hypothetical protein